MYELVKDWPQLPDGFEMGNPTGISIDSRQTVYVFIRAGRTWTDPMPDFFISANTILQLDRHSGEIIGDWGAHLFILPHGLKVDINDNIWVTDVGLHQVFKFNHQGGLIMKLGEAGVAGNDPAHFNMPTDIAIVEDGSFYVSDGYGNSRIIKFSPAGEYIFEWGKMGSRPGEFNLPHGIELDARGNVYVADRENNRIQEFDGDGKFVQEWIGNGLGKIYSLTFDKTDGNLIAVDYMIHDTITAGSDMLIFDTLNKLRLKIGRSGRYNGPVSEYHGVAVDNEGSVYIGDILGNRIYKFKKYPDN
jgi:peptidylamidoglycolate lyase